MSQSFAYKPNSCGSTKICPPKFLGNKFFNIILDSIEEIPIPYKADAVYYVRDGDYVAIWTVNEIGELVKSSKLTNIFTLENIAELKTIRGFEGCHAFLRGYYADGDGGGGEFYWDNTSTATDNGGTIFQVSGTTTGRWVRIYDQDINIKWFGVKEDGTTDDTLIIQKVIDYASNNFISTIRFNSKTYLIDGALNPTPAGNGGIRLKPNVNLFFDNSTLQLKTSTTGIYSALNFYGSQNNNILGNLSIIGDNGVIAEYGHGLFVSNCSDINITGNLTVSDCCGDGFYFGELNGGSNLLIPKRVKITNFSISNSGRNGLTVAGGDNLFFENGIISGSHTFTPRASIDIEVNNNLTVNNVIFKNVKTSGSLGTEILVTAITSTNTNTTNVIFEGCDIVSSGTVKAVNNRYGSDSILFKNCSITGYITCSMDTIFNNCNFSLTSTNGSNDYWLYTNIISRLYFNNCKISLKDNRIIFDNVGSSVFFDNSYIKIDRTNNTLLPDSTNMFGDTTSNQLFTSVNSTWLLLFTPGASFNYSGSTFDGKNKKFINSFVSSLLINDSHVNNNMNHLYPVLTAIPTTGTYPTNAKIYFRNPAAGKSEGAVCITGGTPGTWKEFGRVEKFKKGISYQSGTGVATAFTIAHSLGTTPTYINVQPGSANAKGISYITSDATNITVNYDLAPLSGTNNLTFYWEATV